MAAAEQGAEIITEIILAIKRKKELSSLDNDFVRGKIAKILQQDRKLREKVQNSKSFKEFSRSSEFEALKKLVRSELRSVYGVFDLDEKGERKRLLEELGREKSEEGKIHIVNKILILHQSSKERISHYSQIYERIFAVTGEPSSILDLACGANPYSYPLLRCSPFYAAMDLPSDDLADIAEFFRTEGIEGEVLGIDLVRDHERLGRLLEEHPFDVVFLFKALDSLEAVKRNISGKLLDKLQCKWMVVSFPTVSLGGGKRIRKERRAWFEKLLARRGWPYEEFEIGGEAFYVVRPAIRGNGAGP